jgi:alkyl hydroperoxide reductase subunit AhpC
VCTTELGTVARLKPEFDKRGVKVVGLSIDATNDHERWAKDIEETQGATVNFPMIGDPELKVAKLYHMLPAAAGGAAATRTAADNMTVRNVFVIGPDKKVKLILVYPMSAGRNFDEILRVIDALQLNATQNLATPADWRPGQAAIIPTSVKDEDAKKLFPQGFKTLKPYLRIVQPK